MQELKNNFYVNTENEKTYISFDVGIKNLAYCILKFNDANKFNIIDWNCINLLDDLEETPEKCKCCFKKPEKKSKLSKTQNVVAVSTTMCGKKAFFSTTTNDFFCKKHIPENYILPEKQYSSTSIKKLKVPELLKLYETTFKTTADTTGFRRAELLEKIIYYYDNIQLKKIVDTKKINSKHISLITIGEKLKIELDKIIFSNNLSDKKFTVLIENQISTIASRMTSIQAMIVQYFISSAATINSPEKKIELISSKNKLKNCVQETNNTVVAEEKTYKNNKKNGILFCKNILENNEMNQQISFFVSNKKKDDLADCFLQGYYVGRTHK
jgi:hypothetical protein